MSRELVTEREGEEPEAGNTLSPRQQVFLQEFEATGDCVEAARRAGFKKPEIRGHQLRDARRFPRIAEEVKRIQERKRQELIQPARRVIEDVVEELKGIRDFNPKSMFDGSGRLIPIQDMPDAVAKCIKKLRVRSVTRPGLDGKDVTMTTAEIEYHDRLAAMRQLADHLGWMKDLADVDAAAAEGMGNTVVIDWTTMTQRGEEENDADARLRRMEEMAQSRMLPGPAEDDAPTGHE